MAPGTRVKLINDQQDADYQQINHENFNPKQIQKSLMGISDDIERGKDHDDKFSDDSITPNCTALFLNDLE